MNFSTSSTPADENRMPDIGQLGEQLVAKWLQAQGWDILHLRWRCRSGELDLIARQCPVSDLLPPDQTPLAFVEVKTRSRGNWDADGLLAITPKKQAKLYRVAKVFLAAHPELADLPCRFDVASVSYKRLSQRINDRSDSEPVIGNVVMGQAVSIKGYQLVLQDYIESAFD